MVSYILVFRWPCLFSRFRSLSSDSFTVMLSPCRRVISKIGFTVYRILCTLILFFLLWCVWPTTVLFFGFVCFTSIGYLCVLCLRMTKKINSATWAIRITRTTWKSIANEFFVELGIFFCFSLDLIPLEFYCFPFFFGRRRFIHLMSVPAWLCQWPSDAILLYQAENGRANVALKIT